MALSHTTALLLRVRGRGSLTCPNSESLLFCICFEVRRLPSICLGVSSLSMLPNLTFQVFIEFEPGIFIVLCDFKVLISEAYLNLVWFPFK